MFVGVISWQLLGLPSGADLLPHHQQGVRRLPGAVREGAFGQTELLLERESEDEKSAMREAGSRGPRHSVSDRGES